MLYIWEKERMPMPSPSILNDVMGPVMRGPSSSHTAASWRIARTALQLLNDDLESAVIELEKSGVWASNYREQGTALGMDGGLLGLDMADERILHPEKIAGETSISITYRISRFETDHTNTVRLTLQGRSGRTAGIIAVSTGGGMFEIRRFNGHPTDIRGDAYHLFVRTGGTNPAAVTESLRKMFTGRKQAAWTWREEGNLIQIKSPNPFSTAVREKLTALPGTREIVQVDPLLPVAAGNASELPFRDPASMLKFAADSDLSLGRLGLLYESKRSGQGENELKEKMAAVVRIIENGISIGLAGTEYRDRILPPQAHLIEKAARENRVRSGPLVNRLIAYTTALMEAKSAMEVIVAAPTAGACGTFGGTVKAFCDTSGVEEERKLLAYFAGGLIGVFFAMGPGFSAEEHGCQVETGAAGCMAAAALVELSGGTREQSLAAASMSLQNTLGLVCDPVADRVEVPCLGRNVTAGMNALAASTMALSGFDPVIPLNEAIAAVERVGRSLPSALCNTGQGGLADTERARELKRKLKEQARGTNLPDS